jgi:hypothetical protein
MSARLRMNRRFPAAAPEMAKTWKLPDVESMP